MEDRAVTHDGSESVHAAQVVDPVQARIVVRRARSGVAPANRRRTVFYSDRLRNTASGRTALTTNSPASTISAILRSTHRLEST